MPTDPQNGIQFIFEASLDMFPNDLAKRYTQTYSD